MFSSLLASVSSIVPDFSTPAAIHSLLQFDGKWDIHGVFSYTYAYEIQIPHHASFTDLIQVIRNTVPSSYEKSVFKISHVSDSCSSHVVIDDDTSLYAYIRLKSIHCGVRDFPLCVELTNFSASIVSGGGLVLSELHQPLLCLHSISNSSDCGVTESDASLSDLEENRRMCTLDEDDIPIQRFSPGLVFETFRGDEIPENNVQTSELDCNNYLQSNPSSYRMSQQEIATMKEMHVTSRFDPTRIVVDAIYASKKDLDIHLKMLAISNQFQYRIRTSKKSCLHVVCVDFPRCTWAVRAVRLPSVEMFQIRRYNREHQCPIDARKGTTRQATYHIVAELVKHKFCDATTKPYPPNSILSDMRREHGIAMSYKKAWFAKEKALEICFGTVQDSYASLPSMCFMLKKANPGSMIKLTTTHDHLFKAASEVECDRYLKYLDKDDPRIIGYLKSIGKEKWARSCSNQRYSIMTSNLAESMNNVDAVPREYPISQLVDFLIGRTQRWFHERRDLANSTSSTLTKFYESELNELHSASAVMEVRPACSFEFLVIDKNGRSFVVNFQNRTCTCCEFQLDHFVCVHAVAATRCRSGLSCYDYVSSFYTTTAWRATYSGIIHPIPSKESWVLPDEVTQVVCLPPSCDKRPPGRPKKRKIPSKGEHAKQQSCSRCKSQGHNRKTCTNPISLSRA
ncbi:unnamed protein product [Cuscuta campestris]|uniref:SWIM-type domain-containing protein n=1 Tax=Cuscuta campestris TaxID=132261 RepID=A0A484LRZ0_9ASTE|nr:unnamed protein product [Cuscuta campestris]